MVIGSAFNFSGGSMKRCIVCLTFDFDAISGWIARESITPTSVSRGEFGLVGAARILRLLEKHQIRSTWFIPGHTIVTYPEMCARVNAAGHEIAHHGFTHEAPAKLTREQESDVLRRGNDAIRKLTGHNATGYRSPSWDLSEHSVELLLEHGFKYDSSMMAHDYIPYRARIGDVVLPDVPVKFGRTSSLIEMPVSWSLDDLPHFEYVRYPNRLLATMQRTSHVLDNWVDEFIFMKSEVDWGVLTYTFHPQVIGRGYRMLMLERLIARLTELGAVFCRLDEAAEEFARDA
jgi:peptidoglycan/xylan/chitin deacetylase (PgdA/CDA1 family)